MIITGAYYLFFITLKLFLFMPYFLGDVQSL